MIFEAGVFKFYQMRLLRRELSLLALYRTRARNPRIAQLAYWRASFTPLVVGLVFFGTRALGLTETQASIAALALLLSLVLADMQLFIMGVGAWRFARQVLNWRAVESLCQTYVGGREENLQTAGAKNRWDEVPIDKRHLQGFAKIYLQMRENSPSLDQLIVKSAEARALLISLLLLLLVVQFNPQLFAVALPIFFFVSAWPAKRLKASIDFWFTWPILQEAFDWGSVSKLARAV